MKKAKVDRLIREKMAEAHRSGMCDGERRERERHTEILLPDIKGLVYLVPPPSEPRKTVAFRAGSVWMDPFEPSQYRVPFDTHMQIDFEPIVKAVSFSNGAQIRWFDWKPLGPYPVSELPQMRRYG